MKTEFCQRKNYGIPVLACTISTKKISKLDFFNSNFFIDFGNIFSSVVRVRNISKKYMIHDCEIGFYLISVICIYQQFNCWFFLLLNKYFRNTRPHLKMLVFFPLKKRLRKCRKKVRKVVKIKINVTDLIALNFKTKFPGSMNCIVSGLWSNFVVIVDSDTRTQKNHRSSSTRFYAIHKVWNAKLHCSSTDYILHIRFLFLNKLDGCINANTLNGHFEISSIICVDHTKQ